MRWEYLTIEQKFDRLLDAFSSSRTAYDRTLDRVLFKLNAVLFNQERIMATQAEMKAKLDAISEKVSAQTTVIGSVETLLTEVAALVADLRNQLANAGVDQALVDQADQIATSIDQATGRLANDVTTHTPAGT